METTAKANNNSGITRDTLDDFRGFNSVEEKALLAS